MKSETKVGLLFLGVVVLIVLFGYFLGGFNPFNSTNELKLAYNFAGGIEVGSPVRVMGIKVGKVTAIDFVPDMKMPDGEEVKLRVTILVEKKAWATIRKDSDFFINLAGVIGEKFIEVSPGSLAEPEFTSGDLVRGEDPPRIDQLISQSYGLAGKILGMVEKNEGSVVETLQMMNKLVMNLNGLLKQVDSLSSKKETSKLFHNLVTLTNDLAFLTQKTRTADGQKTIELLHRLLWRLDGMDEKAIRKFLQEEGIRARMF